LALFVLFVGLSLRSIRFVGPLVLLGVFVAMENRSSQSRAAAGWGWRDRAVHLVVSAVLVGMFWAICTDRLYHWQGELKRFGSGLLTSEMPTAASRFLRTEGLEGNFLTLWSDGDYLIWHNAGQIKVAEDGRTAPFPMHLSTRLRSLYGGDARALKQFETDYVVDGAVVPWYSSELHHLLSLTPGWRLLFIGPYSSVWMKEQSFVAQSSRQRLAELSRLERFLIVNEQTAFDEESWLSFAAALYRRARVFAAVGRIDLVAATRTTARRYGVENPELNALFTTALGP